MHGWGHTERDTGGMGRGAGLTGLVIQKIVLLHELPVQLQGLGCPGRVEDIGVLVEKLLEGVECGLAHLQRGQRTHGTEDAHGKADASMKPYLPQALAPSGSYRSHLVQQLLLSFAEQHLALDGSDGLRVQLAHGLAGQPEGNVA